MSTPTTVQSNQVPMSISTDSGVTWKNIVCKRTWNFNGTTAVNSEESDCGIEKGLGAPDWTMDFEGIVNTTPTSTTEISAKDMGDLWLAQTLVMVKVLTGAGTGKNLYISGSAYITDYAVQNSVGNLLAFTATLNGVGAPDFTV
jgi:hypothetical protein